jgi:hypothetical protein
MKYRNPLHGGRQPEITKWILPTKPLGLQEGFWGSITAIAVVQSELGATRNSARSFAVF